jgi:N-acetylmuramoyl-L-alanine amidase
VRTCAKIRRPATLTAVMAAILLTALSAHAGTLTSVKLRVGGKELALKNPAVYDGREVYIPLEALQSFRAGYTVTRREETAVVTVTGGPTFEAPLARPGKLPMLPLSSLIKPLKMDFELQDGTCEVFPQGKKPTSEGEKDKSAPSTQRPNDPVQPPQALETLASRGVSAKQPPGVAVSRKPADDVAPATKHGEPQTGTGTDTAVETANPSEGTQGPTQPAVQPQPTIVKPFPGAIRIQDVAFDAIDATHARLRIKTSGKTAPYAQLLQDPSRLAIDIPNSAVEMEQSESAVEHPFASALRVEPGEKPNTTRVSLELSKLISYRVLPAGPDGITVNLALPKGAGRKMSDVIIVVDPGHGGNDGDNHNGCKAFHNGVCIFEKNLTLAIAKKVQKGLEEKGATVVMTRTKDVSLGLKARPKIATDNNADLFVSIHIDYVDYSGPSGTTTYYHKDDPSSRALAHSIVQHIAKVSGIPNRRARSDSVLYGNGLAVLRYSTVPSTLVEVGFISNPRDRSKLVKPEFQQAVAEAIVRGIEGYIGSDLPDEVAAVVK